MILHKLSVDIVKFCDKMGRNALIHHLLRSIKNQLEKISDIDQKSLKKVRK